MPKIGKGRGGGGSSGGPALDGEGAIALLVLAAVVLLPIALIVGIGWGLWQLGIIVREKVFGDCLHDRHAVIRSEFDVRVCTECGAWHPLETNPGKCDHLSSKEILEGNAVRACIKCGVVQTSDDNLPIEWQPRETNPGICDHLSSTETLESDIGRIRICPDCGCWRESFFEPWEPANTCPIYKERDDGGKEPILVAPRTDGEPLC